MHLLQSDIPLVTINEAADLDDRARIAALADHLVDPRGAQIRILRQGVAERQVIDEIGSGHTIVTADFDGDGRDEIVYYRRGI